MPARAAFSLDACAAKSKKYICIYYVCV